jgi:hypothetical protein
MFEWWDEFDPLFNVLTTSTIGNALPEIVDRFGPKKKIDFVFSLSHDLFLEEVPKSKMTGIYIDKKGNINIQLNLAGQMNVEHSPEQWTSIRNFFVSLIVKFKIEQTGATKKDKIYSWIPKVFAID